MNTTELLGPAKHANQHLLSRLTMESHSDELRTMALAVEVYNDALVEALESAQRKIAELESRADAEPVAVICFDKNYTRTDGSKPNWNEMPKVVSCNWLPDGDYPVYLTAPSAPVVPDDYFASLVSAARVRADKAMRKFPQPNYVLNKVAEENGEVIKAVIHYTEGREKWTNVEGEIIDNLAMLIRLVTEGDQVIGFTPPSACRAAMLQGGK